MVSDRRRVFIVGMCSDDSYFDHLIYRSFGERVKIINSRHKSNYKGELELNRLLLQVINQGSSIQVQQACLASCSLDMQIDLGPLCLLSGGPSVG